MMHVRNEWKLLSTDHGKVLADWVWQLQPLITACPPQIFDDDKTSPKASTEKKIRKKMAFFLLKHSGFLDSTHSDACQCGHIFHLNWFIFFNKTLQQILLDPKVCLNWEENSAERNCSFSVHILWVCSFSFLFFFFFFFYFWWKKKTS